MAELRYDMAQYYPLKAVLESVLGHGTYLKLKETGTLKDWKYEISRLLQAIQLSIKATVKVADDEWRKEIQALIEHGKKVVSSSTTVDELLANLSATLTRLVFLQIGFVPQRSCINKVVLRGNEWELDRFRSVQFVQTKKQKQDLAAYLYRRQKVSNT